MKGSVTVRLRAWLVAHPEGEVGDIYAAFLPGDDFKTLTRALNWLTERGELYMPGQPYRYGAVPHGNAARETKRTAIYTTLRNLAKVRRVVDFDEVVRLAEVDRSYARRYVRHLEALGYLARRPAGLAVLDKAMHQAEAPPYNQREDHYDGVHSAAT